MWKGPRGAWRTPRASARVSGPPAPSSGCAASPSPLTSGLCWSSPQWNGHGLAWAGTLIPTSAAARHSGAPSRVGSGSQAEGARGGVGRGQQNRACPPAQGSLWGPPAPLQVSDPKERIQRPFLHCTWGGTQPQQGPSMVSSRSVWKQAGHEALVSWDWGTRCYIQTRRAPP